MPTGKHNAKLRQYRPVAPYHDLQDRMLALADSLRPGRSKGATQTECDLLVLALSEALGTEGLRDVLAQIETTAGPIPALTAALARAAKTKR
jgi:hypothetical protein